MVTNEKTEGYEAPKIVVLGPAEDLTQVKNGRGSDATSIFHQSI
jgi:hypothetical protein